ncbi:MAG TPA: PhzF family phenazine biosynthesis protein [Chloroflexota bacterium]|nr:PhzF family phenazine biosynthesis protein [Chloroflexota bacterium]
MDYRFFQVDVFTDRMFGGNSLAVFPDAEGLTDDQMQSLALEMNLAETTFVLPPRDPDCVAALRIFTSSMELPFAGHPTVGTAFVLARLGRIPESRFALEEAIGAVSVRLEGDPHDPTFLWMRHREASFAQPIAQRRVVAEMLGIDEFDLLDRPIQSGSTGVAFLYVPLRSRDAVDRVRLLVSNFSTLAPDGDPSGVFVFTPEPDGAYSRMFGGAALGIVEDPATGGASGPLGSYLVKEGLVPPAEEVRLVSRQGVKLGRPSSIHIRVETQDGGPTVVEVGGSVVPVLDGTVHL